MAEAVAEDTRAAEGRDERAAEGRRRRVPAPLVALLAATAVLGLTWALLTPPMQAPDENAHVGYVQALADGHELPGIGGRRLFSTEQTQASAADNSDQTAAVLDTRPEWSKAAYERWQAQERRIGAAQRTDGGGPNPASGNPPLYYLVAAGAWRAVGGDFFDRLLAARLVSLVFLLVTVAAAWLLAGEVVGRRPVLQLAAASVAALAPMMTFISTSVSPDSLLYALWTLALWLGVRALKRGLGLGGALALFAVVGLACVVKSASYALLPGAALVLAVGLWRRRPLRAGRTVALVAAAAAGLVATAGVWWAIARGINRAAAPQLSSASATSGLNLRELASYAWQFYLPKLPFQNDFFPAYHGPPFYVIWIKGTWARFGWLEVMFPGPVYAVLSALTVLVCGAAAAFLWRVRRSLDWAVGAFLALVTVALIAGLHWSEFRISPGGFNQGRYLLPLVGIAGLLVAWALQLLPARRRPLGAAVVIATLFALQLFSLELVAERFYA